MIKILLVEGNSGTPVKYLQYGIRIMCFNPKRTDGVFDTNTTAAVKKYQTARGLSVDGKVGDGTWNTLKSDIKPIQTALKKKNYYSGSVDGVAGDSTYNGLIQFQSDNGLSVDGKVGTKTWNKLNSSNPVKGSCTNVTLLRIGSRGVAVKVVQERLIALNYNCGSGGADGIFGNTTRLAVIKFQKNNGLNADGIVGKKTLACLNSIEAKPNDGSADLPNIPDITTGASLLDYAIGTISEEEGSYTDINPTDVLSIGLLQWRASRAYHLLVSIRNKNIYSFDSIMGENSTIAGHVKSGSSAPFESLRPTDLSADELSKLKQLLSTEESHVSQEELKRADANSYIENGKAKGITDDKVIIYYADCYNQSPSGINRIGEQITNQWANLTLDAFHNQALNDQYMGSDGTLKGLGAYPKRRNRVYAKASAYTPSENLSDMIENMVTIAIAEQFADRFEGLPEENRGKENYNKYLEWFPYAQGSAWCACFVSWCANRAGLVNLDGQIKLIPKSVSVQEYKDFYESKNRFGEKGNYIPKRGDIFINKSNGSSHVGIVTAYNPETNTFSTIEGNTDDDTVKELTRSMTAAGLTGFGINNPN